MDTIEQLKVLARVVESGSFSRTASELGLGQPAVSRAVAALEQRVGARLLHRNTRSLSLTEEGQRVYERALHILEEFETLAGSAARVEGRRRRLRVSRWRSFVFYQGTQLHPSLRQVLKAYEVEPLGVQLLFQRDRFLPTRVRSFLDHFVAVMAREPWLAPSR